MGGESFFLLFFLSSIPLVCVMYLFCEYNSFFPSPSPHFESPLTNVADSRTANKVGSHRFLFFCISDVLLLLLAYVEVIDESKQVEQKIILVRSIGILASFQSNYFFFLSYKLAVLSCTVVPARYIFLKK